MTIKTAIFDERNWSRTRGRAQAKHRALVASAFREVAGGVSDREAGSRTRDFYRSSGADWTRNLD